MEIEAKGVERLPQSLYDLARRCLHIAFVWNDHNFRDSPKEMARKEAAKYGIADMEAANAWLDNPDEWPVVRPIPTPADDGWIPAEMTMSMCWAKEYVAGYNDALRLVRVGQRGARPAPTPTPSRASRRWT